MSRLEFPIKNQLREPVDAPALRRIWDRIDGHWPEARRRRRRLTVGALGLAAAAAALVVGVSRDSGPLRFGDGRALFGVDAPTDGARLPLSDGSTIELGGGARFEPLDASGSTFLAVLQRGSAVFDVRAGGPRRWQIECGLATVESADGRFSCARAPGRLRVSVQRGAVVVRGERVVDRARRVGAGESLDVGDAPAFEADAPAIDAPPSWRELARVGHPDAAFEALGAAGVRRETQRLEVDDLLALADVARLSGHARDAVAPLERALVLGVPPDALEDVRVHLVEADVDAGDPAATRAAAAAYLRDFPLGGHRGQMQARLVAR